MSKIGEDLFKNKTISDKQLIDYVISIQLAKIERYNNQTKNIIDSKSEEAMANMVELLKIRKSYR